MVIFGTIAILLSQKARGDDLKESMLHLSDLEARGGSIAADEANRKQNSRRHCNCNSSTEAVGVGRCCSKMQPKHGPHLLKEVIANSSTTYRPDKELEPLAKAQFLGIDCGTNHQVAVESALSSVLRVSTLVGFRAQQSELQRPHSCVCKLMSEQVRDVPL